jgi:hypothetical protein
VPGNGRFMRGCPASDGWRATLSGDGRRSPSRDSTTSSSDSLPPGLHPPGVSSGWMPIEVRGTRIEPAADEVAVERCASSQPDEGLDLPAVTRLACRSASGTVQLVMRWLVCARVGRRELRSGRRQVVRGI